MFVLFDFKGISVETGMMVYGNNFFEYDGRLFLMNSESVEVETIEEYQHYSN